MKRFFVLAVLFMATAICASAQYTKYYTVEQVGQEYPSLYMFQVDWNNKLFFLEGDKHNDGPIKNYKENGNTRTFDVWYAPSSGLNEKIYTVKFTTEEGGSYTMELDMGDGYKAVYKLSTTEPVSNRYDSGSGSGSGTVNDKISEKAQAVKDAFGKGLDAIKKKSQEKKAEKAEKKAEEDKAK